jgi:hypothetical protein
MEKDIFHRRSPRVKNIPLEKIEIDPNFKYDNYFVKLILKTERGTIPCSYTRIRSELITSGSFIREDGKNIRISNLNINYLPHSISQIRQGNRHPIQIYWNKLSPHQSKFVCPDDEVTLAAYKALGIKYVPAIICDPRLTRGEAGSIWAQMKGGIASYKHALAPLQARYHSLISLEEIDKINIDLLYNKCIETRKSIREFHLDNIDGTHYHQMLYASIIRHERTLLKVRDFINTGHIEFACALVRMSYEAFLSFYVDWLAPSFIGPRLQLISHINFRRRNQLSPEQKENEKRIRQILGGFDSFLNSVLNKAQVSPLGEEFYNTIYPTLSWVTHQAYGLLERENLQFKDSSPQDFADLEKTLLVWLAIITTSLLFSIQNDIGITNSTFLEKDGF